MKSPWQLDVTNLEIIDWTRKGFGFWDVGKSEMNNE